MTQQGYATTFSLRKSIIVWIAGAVLGWVIAVVSIYNVLRNSEANIAETQPGVEEPTQERSLAIEQPADRLTPEELEALIETAPAAGGNAPAAGGNAPAEPEDETSNE